MENYEKELAHILQLQQTIAKDLMNAPEGILHCRMLKGRYPQYSVVDPNDSAASEHGKYLKKDEMRLAAQLAQKEYDLKLLKALKCRERSLRSRLKAGEFASLTRVYDLMPEAKRILVKPRIMSDEEYIETWYKSGKGGSNPLPIAKGFPTMRGETVRSKSEKIIVDKLFVKGIPYKYEAPLKLPGGITIFPDVAALNIRLRKTFYIEHMGMMEDPDYCVKALEKLDNYGRAHIFPGDNLLLTYESSRKPIDLDVVDALIDRYLL